MTLKKFVCAHASYTHPCHFVSADVRVICRKLLASTQALANTKSSRGQAYNKLEINIYLSSSLSSRARSTWCYTEYVTYLPNKSIFLFHVIKRKMKESENMKEKRNSDSNNKLRLYIMCIILLIQIFSCSLQLEKITYFIFTINNLPDK